MWWRKHWQESLLIIAVISLVAQLAAPRLNVWIYRPRPGHETTQAWAKNYRGLSVSYLVSLPANYSEHDRSPLLIVLHGAGERGSDLEELRRSTLHHGMRSAFENEAVLVSPQCLRDSAWDAGALIQALAELSTRYSIDRKRVYVVGYSMGGFGAWELAASAPERVAGIVPIAGGCRAEIAGRLKPVKIWAVHGADDGVVAAKLSEESVQMVLEVGGTARLTILPDVGHDMTQLLEDSVAAVRWLSKKEAGELLPLSAAK